MNHTACHKIALLFLFLAYACTFNNIQAQTLSTSSNRAIRFYEEGNRNYRLLNYVEARKNLERAVRADDQFIEAYIMLGEVNNAAKNFQSAANAYQAAIKIDPDKYPEAHYFAGIVNFKIQHFEMALSQLKRYLSYNQHNQHRDREAVFFINSSKFAIEAMENPVPFQPKNLGPYINTGGDEYINAVSSDELLLYFTGANKEKGATSTADRFFFSHRNSPDDDWQPSQLVGSPFNAGGNEGALTITHDRQFLLFAGCHWPDGFGSCDIYAARITDGKFGNPRNLGSEVNSSAWDSQPSLAPDGRTLYFASTRAGGYGNSDLWKSTLQDDGAWSAPENLGDVINTYGSEMAPFIHADGTTLYFSSDRHPGMGGIDLFMSRLDENGIWSKPVNLGYPVNTPGDEINIIVNARGNKAYISANLQDGLGGYDIYEFELHEKVRPTPSTYLKGIITDAKTKLPVEAYFVLISLDTGEELVRSFSDSKNGEFLLCIPTNHNYALNVSSEGYMFFSENFSLTGFTTEVEPFIMNISLNPITIGETIVLKNIFFDTGKYQLKPESIAEMKKLVEFLEHNPSLAIEVSGHTDNIGSKDFNLELSRNRANAVHNYLVEEGISPNRLSYTGHGYSKPIASNETGEGRAQNRRTEILITEITTQNKK